MVDIILKDENYTNVRVLFEIYNNLGSGFSKIVYKDAPKYEFKLKNSHFQKRKRNLFFHSKILFLKHKFYTYFVVLNKIILKIKSIESINDKHISQCINYQKYRNVNWPF